MPFPVGRVRQEIFRPIFSELKFLRSRGLAVRLRVSGNAAWVVVGVGFNGCGDKRIICLRGV